MAKRFDFQDFRIVLKSEATIGGVITIRCSSIRTKYHVSQRAQITTFPRKTGKLFEAKGYAQWSNRPWENYPYENAILALADNIERKGEKELAADIREWSEIHAKEKAEAAEKFVSDFKAEWDKARPSLREAVAAGAPFETEDEANFALAALKMGNILNS